MVQRLRFWPKSIGYWVFFHTCVVRFLLLQGTAADPNPTPTLLLEDASSPSGWNPVSKTLHQGVPVEGITIPSSLSPLTKAYPPTIPNKRLELDLSGRLETHLAGPTIGLGYLHGQQQQQQPVPLWEWNQERAPSLLVAADYDFSKRWFGATRLSTTLRFFPKRQWSGWQKQPADWNNDNDTERRHESIARKNWQLFCPSTLDMTREHDIHGECSSTNAMTLQWPVRHCNKYSSHGPSAWTSDDRSNNDIRNSVAKLICTAHGKPSPHRHSVSLSIPIHRRFRWDCRLFNNRDSSSLSSGVVDSNTEQDWWIPNVRVNAFGRMVSTNELRLHNDLRLKFSVRRRLNWGLVGGFFAPTEEGEPENTVLQLQVQGISLPSISSRCCISFQSQLEQPLQSIHLLVRQDIVL